MEDMNKFDDVAGPEENEFPMQDKITTKINAKGEIQAEVRIGGVLSTVEDVDKVVGQHLYAWVQLRKHFPNLVKPKPVGILKVGEKE
jgi:hypothetical protein